MDKRKQLSRETLYMKIKNCIVIGENGGLIFGLHVLFVKP